LLALVNKLGHGANRFFPCPVNAGEYEILVLRDELDNAIALKNVDEAETSLAKVKVLLTGDEISTEFKTGFQMQTILRCEASLKLMKGEDTQVIRELLDTAIKITIPKYEAKLVNTYPLCGDEIEIICMLAEVDYAEGNHEPAIALLEKLALNIRKRYVDPHEKAHSLTFVLYNLTNFLGQEGRHEEALALCNEAIKEGERERAYRLLPELKFNKACGLSALKRSEGEVKDLVFQAYYGCLAHGKVSTAKEIKRLALELFEISIES